MRNKQRKNNEKLKEIEAKSELEVQKKQYGIQRMKIITIIIFIMLVLLYYAYNLRTRSNRILKRLASTRSDFFTNITHELRTPLTVIQGLNRQMQQRKDLTEKEKIVFREAIERQSSNLLNLVNQLLDLAKLKSGVDEPQWRRGDIIAYLEMTAEAYTLYAKEKGITLIFYSDLDSKEIDFIPSYIDIIVTNLLSNAIKHTEAGGKIDFIIIQGQSADTITIRVSDTGEGIPKEHLDRIFDLFYQNPNAKNISGTGIGLAFAKTMVEKMKGKIKIESELGQGSVFTINLPTTNKKLRYISPLLKERRPSISQPKNQKDAIVKIEEAEASNNKAINTLPLILLVEDNNDILLYIKTILEDEYRIITAWNGEEGLALAEKHIPDLIITDVMMPVKDGYEFANEIKDNKLLNHIPVIMVTAKTTDEDRIKGLSCGVEAYIRKPFQHEELLIRIKNIFEKRHLLKEKYMSAIIHSGSNKKMHNDVNMDFLQTITNIIYAEINNPKLNSTFLADKMAISVSQLSRKLNGITGYSTISYVLQLKLNKAKKLLATEDISITEVADACGFYDANYFSRTFKKEFGVSPSNFQKLPNLI